jgi:hypothetical protein
VPTFWFYFIRPHDKIDTFLMIYGIFLTLIWLEFEKLPKPDINCPIRNRQVKSSILFGGSFFLIYSQLMAVTIF